MAAVGLISLVMGASGVRAISHKSSVCEPAIADLLNNMREGFLRCVCRGCLDPCRQCRWFRFLRTLLSLHASLTRTKSEYAESIAVCTG